jgi:hypothetical protein
MEGMRNTYKLLAKKKLKEASLMLERSGNWGSSGSIVSGYRLDDREIEVPCPTEAKGLFL